MLRSGTRTAALLLMTSSGLLRSRVCRFDSDIDFPLLERLNQTLSAEFLGQPLSTVSLAQVQTLLVALGEAGLVCAPALTAFVELVQESAEAEVLLPGS